MTIGEILVAAQAQLENANPRSRGVRSLPDEIMSMDVDGGRAGYNR